MRESLGVSLPSRPLLLKLGLLSLPWALCAGLHAVGLGVWLVLALGALLVLSGLAIWKPVQLHGLTALFGGFQGARWVHFLAMAGVVGFVVVHLLLVLLVPRTLLPMIIGREWRRGRRSEG